MADLHKLADQIAKLFKEVKVEVLSAETAIPPTADSAKSNGTESTCAIFIGKKRYYDVANNSVISV